MFICITPFERRDHHCLLIHLFHFLALLRYLVFSLIQRNVENFLFVILIFLTDSLNGFSKIQEITLKFFPIPFPLLNTPVNFSKKFRDGLQSLILCNSRFKHTLKGFFKENSYCTIYPSISFKS